MLDQIIAELSKHLPAETLIRHDDMIVPGEFLYLANYVDEKGNKPVIGQFYKIKVPVIKMNKHLHRMRIAYLKGGLQELFNYMNQYFDKRKSEQMKWELLRLTGQHELYEQKLEEKLEAA